MPGAIQLQGQESKRRGAVPSSGPQGPLLEDSQGPPFLSRRLQPPSIHVATVVESGPPRGRHHAVGLGSNDSLPMGTQATSCSSARGALGLLRTVETTSFPFPTRHFLPQTFYTMMTKAR